MLYTITTGTRADYESLKHHHYAGNPANPVLYLVARLTQSPSPSHAPIAVLTISHPTLNFPARKQLFDGYFNTPDKRENARRINAELRVISRLIVHPSFRGSGIGKDLVAHYLKSPLTKYTETLARMGRVCPLFERAGMTAADPKRNRRDTMLIARLEEECIEPTSLLDPQAATRALTNERVQITLSRWLNLSRATRTTIPTPEALSIAAMHLIAKPIAYGHISDHSPQGGVGDGPASPVTAPSPTDSLPMSSAPEEPRHVATGEATSPRGAEPVESANEHKPPRRGGGNSTRKHSRARVARRPAAVLHPAQPRCASISDAHPNPDTTPGRRRNKPAPEPPYPFHLPTTPANLHTFIKDELSYDIQRTSYIPGHSAPFDYLVHTFFEGLGNFEQLHSHPEVPLGRATDTPNDCVVWACRGGGKTFLGALATLLDLIFKPNIEIRIIGGSLDQSRRMFNHLKKFFKIHNFSTHLAGKIGRCGLTLQNGSHVEILAQSETAIRGTRIQKLRCDEVALFKPEVWQAAQLVTRTMTTTLTVADAGHERQVDLIVPGAIEAFSTMHEAGTVMDSAVNDAHNGTRTLFKWGIADIVEGATEADRASLLRVEPALAPHTTLREQGDKESINPPPAPCLPLSLPPSPSPLSPCSGHIPITDAFSLMSRVSHEAWQSEMLCLRPSRSNLVYNDFNEHTHLFTDAPWERAGILRCVMGMDFGFRGETVILWGVLDAEHRLYIVDEIAKAERSLQWHIDAMNSKCAAIGLPRPDWIGIDPAANQRNFHSAISSRDALVRAGFATRDRALTVEHGIDLVKARLAPAGQLSRNDAPPNHTIPAPRLFIHARCTRLVESLRTYHYDHKNKRSGVPIKDGPDHACDALRYLVINLERPCNNAISRYL